MKTTSTIDVTELRAVRDKDNKPSKIVGYAAVFNKDSKTMRTKEGRKFIERIAPGAFADELKDPDTEVRATVLHNQGIILGRRSKGTVMVEEDKDGLRAEITPGDTQAGRDAFVQVERGDLDKMSFGFDDFDAKMEKRSDGVYVRTISKVKGFGEITLADNRAIYSDTSAHLRMADEQIAVIDPPAKPAEERAIVQVEDKSLKYYCNYASSEIRTVIACMEGVISGAERLQEVKAALTNEDHRAIDDIYVALRDLRRRITPTLAALDAVTDQKAGPDTGDEERAMEPQLLSRAIGALHDAGLKQPSQLRGFGRRLGQMFAPPAPPAPAPPATNGEAKPETPATPAAPAAAKTDPKQN
jgi:HK97 family phage prohead protease